MLVEPCPIGRRDAVCEASRQPVPARSSAVDGEGHGGGASLALSARELIVGDDTSPVCLGDIFDRLDLATILAAAAALADPEPDRDTIAVFPAAACYRWLLRLGLPDHAQRAWRLLLSRPRPPVTMALIAATPDGLFAVQRRLAELRAGGAHAQADSIESEPLLASPQTTNPAFAGVVGRRRIR